MQPWWQFKHEWISIQGKCFIIKLCRKDCSIINKLNSLVFLLSITAHIHNLQNVVVGTELQRTNVDLYIFFQEIFGQLTNLFWPSGTPHQSLAVRLRNKIKLELHHHTARFPPFQMHEIPLSGKHTLIWSTIFLIWGSKPMSNILSASSRTR